MRPAVLLAGLSAALLVAATWSVGPHGKEAPSGSQTRDGTTSSGGDPSRKRVTLPEEDPNFISLLEALTDRASLYRKHALGFTCRETVITAKYDVDDGDFRRSDRVMYDYLFEEQAGGLKEVREEIVQKSGGEKTRGTDFESQAPPAYAWAALFSRENRGRFHFRPEGQVVKAYRLLTLVSFVGISPNPGGTDIAGWSGHVALESRSHNLWSVEAAPSGQDVRLDVEILRYRRAFAIAGVPLASRPHGWTLSVVFGIELNGLSYPTEQILGRTSLGGDGRMSIEDKTTFRYESYRFFETAVGAETLKGTQTDSDPNG